MFDVIIEGVELLSDVDIFGMVGHDAAIDVTFPSITVTDGMLDIDFLPHPGADNPKLCALRVSLVPEPGTASFMALVGLELLARRRRRAS
jgi:hypothetical protein